MNYILAYKWYDMDKIVVFTGNEMQMAEKLHEVLDARAFTRVTQAVWYIRNEFPFEPGDAITLTDSTGRVLVSKSF